MTDGTNTRCGTIRLPAQWIEEEEQMARRANDTWRANDGTLFDGEDAKARAKKHDAWCELVDLIGGMPLSADTDPEEMAAYVADNRDHIQRILKAGPEKGGAA